MTELLVPVCRNSGEVQVDQFYGLLTTYPNLEWVAPNLEVADIAARIRAQHRLRTPDALQAATAVRSHATGLVTNDAIFEQVQSFRDGCWTGLLYARNEIKWPSHLAVCTCSVASFACMKFIRSSQEI